MREQLQNIPFYWTALAHFLACMVMLYPLPERGGRKYRGGMAALFLAAMLGYMAVTEPQNGIRFNILMIGFAVLNGLMMSVLGKLNLSMMLYYGTRAFILGGFTCSLGWQLYIFLAIRFSTFQTGIAEGIFIGFIYLLVCGTAIIIERPRREITRELSVSLHVAVSTLIIGILVYILSSLSFTSLDTPFGASTYAEAFNIRTLAYLSGVTMLLSMHILLCGYYVERERDMLSQMLDMQINNVRLSQESIELVNRKYHDLKHQIALLRSEVGKEQKLAFLDQMEAEIKIYESQNKTGNPVLDTILTTKGMLCGKEGITLTCVADGKALSFLSVGDVSALFGNALDNAIEAARQVPEAANRRIHLTVSRRKGFILILVENPYIGKLSMRENIPRTTKEDKGNHGYGIKSILSIVKRYDGSMTISGEEGLFELRILIPDRKMPAKEESDGK